MSVLNVERWGGNEGTDKSRCRNCCQLLLATMEGIVKRWRGGGRMQKGRGRGQHGILSWIVVCIVNGIVHCTIDTFESENQKKNQLRKQSLLKTQDSIAGLPGSLDCFSLPASLPSLPPFLHQSSLPKTSMPSPSPRSFFSKVQNFIDGRSGGAGMLHWYLNLSIAVLVPGSVSVPSKP